MRGSFGGSYGMGRSSGGSSGGGGGSDGGGMLRTMGRVVRRAGYNSLQDPLSSSSSSSSSSALKSPAKKLTQKPNSYKHPTLSISSSSSINSTANNSSNLLVSGGNWPVSTIPTWFSTANDDDNDDDDDDDGDDDQWEYVGDSVDRVFGAVPSDFEVQNALLSLQQVIPPISTSSRFSNSETIFDTEKDGSIAMEKASSGSSDSDWIEPSMQIGFPHQRFPRSSGLDRVYDAFHLLQTEPNVRRMVLSLSSDKAVWDAIMNNEAVREIRDSYYKAAEPSPLIPVEDPDASDTNPNVLVWIFDNMKVKFLEVIGAISEFFGEIFKPLEEDETEHLDSDNFSERLKSTFLLTIVVLLIVVVARGQSD